MHQFLCPKHVEFYSKNKFDKLVHLVGFIIRIYHDARSPERQKASVVFDGRVLVSCWCTHSAVRPTTACCNTHLLTVHLEGGCVLSFEFNRERSAKREISGLLTRIGL